VVVCLGYFLVYYGLFTFLIKKLDFKTPGREEGQEVKLYTRKDVEEKKGKAVEIVSAEKVAYVMHICECRKQTACYSANKL